MGCRNFFALLVLIPLQRCIPLHQQVCCTSSDGALLTGTAGGISNRSRHALYLYSAKTSLYLDAGNAKQPAPEMNSLGSIQNSSRMASLACCAGHYTTDPHFPGACAGSCPCPVDVRIRGRSDMGHANQRRPDGRHHSAAAGRPVRPRRPLSSYIRAGALLSWY